MDDPSLYELSLDDIKIQRLEWPGFLYSFTQQHRGWLVNVRRVPGPQYTGGRAALPASTALWCDDRILQSVQPGIEPSAVLIRAGSGDEQVSLLIKDVVGVFNRHIGNTHQGLRIDCADGLSTLLEFRTAAEPQTMHELAELLR